MTDEILRELGEAAAKTIERKAFLAVTAGTNVHYTEDQDESGILYICGENCDGHKPSASDPLAQFKCTCCEPHCRITNIPTRRCYVPRLIDQQVAEEIANTQKGEDLDKLEDLLTRMGGWRSEEEEGTEEAGGLEDSHE